MTGNDGILPRRALLSVSDKTGIVEFARRLEALGVEILSTGGTAKVLREAGVTVVDVSTYTGFPEIMGGRVKTLHPFVHGGILARRGVDDALMQEHGFAGIDLVVVNLYPFRETVAREGVSLAEAVENIDIGGPAMLRSAAKNFAFVTVLVLPSDYPSVLTALEQGSIDLKLREKLSIKAFRHTAEYDAAVAAYLSTNLSEPDNAPDVLILPVGAEKSLRYGENPHQQAAFYPFLPLVANSLSSSLQLQGKELSFNNFADADAALAALLRFDDPACVIVKHANPCGVACADRLADAYEAAYRCDPTSAFGGIIAFNRCVNVELAKEIISRQFVEVILAPEFSEDALAAFAEKSNLRLLQVRNEGKIAEKWQVQSLRGGLLVQTRDEESEFVPRVVSAREPTHEELRDLLFAWQVVKAVKSNAIVLAKNRATIGIGAGQTSRVYAAKIATWKAADVNLPTQGSVLASDAFFPFRDGVDAAAEAGIRAIIQTGGSIRDPEVIQAANEHDIAMIFTGMRHFKH